MGRREMDDEMKDLLGEGGDGRKLARKDNKTLAEENGAGQLRAFVDRIEREEEEIRGLKDGVKEIYAEAKGSGYDVKILRKVVALRRQDREKREEEETILEIYMSALGMI